METFGIKSETVTSLHLGNKVIQFKKLKRGKRQNTLTKIMNILPKMATTNLVKPCVHLFVAPTRLENAMANHDSSCVTLPFFSTVYHDIIFFYLMEPNGFSMHHLMLAAPSN